MKSLFILLFISLLFACSSNKSNIEERPIPQKDTTDKKGSTPIENKFEIQSNVLLNPRLPIKFKAYGRNGKDGKRETLDIDGNGLCHPDIKFVNGWNGWKYVMALTPFFGVAGTNSKWENPHIFATNDDTFQSWTQLNNEMPIDLPQTTNLSFWADTDILLDDDGYLYCLYKGNTFSGIFPGLSFLCYRRSKDGNDWSDRHLVYSMAKTWSNLGFEVVSPSMVKEDSLYTTYGIAFGTTEFKTANMSGNRAMFRKSGKTMGFEMKDFVQSDFVNFTNKPWEDYNSGYSVWHFNVTKHKNIYFMVVGCGENYTAGAYVSYLGYSFDGKTFTFCEEELENATRSKKSAIETYRSAILVDSYVDNIVKLKLFMGQKNGYLRLQELTLKYK